MIHDKICLFDVASMIIVLTTYNNINTFLFS